MGQASLEKYRRKVAARAWGKIVAKRNASGLASKPLGRQVWIKGKGARPETDPASKPSLGWQDDKAKVVQKPHTWRQCFDRAQMRRGLDKREPLGPHRSKLPPVLFDHCQGIEGKARRPEWHGWPSGVKHADAVRHELLIERLIAMAN